MHGRFWRRSLVARMLATPLAIVLAGTLLLGLVAWRMAVVNADRGVHQRAADLAAAAAAMVHDASHALAVTRGAEPAASAAPGLVTRAATDSMRQQDSADAPRMRVVALNPTSAADRADAYETRLIAAFEADHSMKRADDDVSEPDGDYAVCAFPIAVSENGCLRCHSKPAVAPPERVATHGKTAGFGWKMHEVVAAAVAYVPKQDARAGAAGPLRVVVSGVALLLMLALGMIGWNVRTRVSVPTRQMLAVSQSIRHGDWTSRFMCTDSDELRSLALSFQDTTRWLRERVANEEKLRAMFQQFVPASVAARALGRDASEIIEGTRQSVTVMVINIRNFRLLMEHLPPQDTVTTLNEFFSQVNGVIVEHDGLVSKYLGDTVLAFFGMPVQSETHSLDAIRASLAVPRCLHDLYVRLDEDFGWQLGVGIGIATGEPIVGHFGSSEHYEYTILGDVVAEAHALEEISKGVPEEDTIVVDETTYRDVMSDVQVFDLGTKTTASGRSVRAFAVQGMRKEARAVLAA